MTAAMMVPAGFGMTVSCYSRIGNRRGRSGGADGLSRTHCGAGSAVHTFVRVNLILGTALADGAGRAMVQALATAPAGAGNLISHGDHSFYNDFAE